MKLCELTQNELCLLPEADLSLSQLREHASQCPLCQAFAAKIRQQDRQISTLFYPKGPNWSDLVRTAVLPSVSQVVAKKERALGKIAVAFALAASLLIGVVGLLTQFNKPQNPNAFATNDAAQKDHSSRQNEGHQADPQMAATLHDPSLQGLANPSSLASDSQMEEVNPLPGLAATKSSAGNLKGPEGILGSPNQPPGIAVTRMGLGEKDRIAGDGNNLRSLMRKDPLVGQRIKFMVELCNQQREMVVSLVKPSSKDILPLPGGFGGGSKVLEVTPEALVRSYEELIGSDLPALLKSLPQGTKLQEMKALLDHLERTESEYSRMAADNPSQAQWLKQLVTLSRTGILQIRTTLS